MSELPLEDFLFSAGGGFLLGAVAVYAIKKANDKIATKDRVRYGRISDSLSSLCTTKYKVVVRTS